jgi:hypothetical protein
VARRTGIDLSSANAALVHVREGQHGPELRGFALVDASGDLDAVAAELRQARRQYRLPRRAEVVAWSGEPRAHAATRAGFAVERVISPPDALSRIARMQPTASAPDAVTALVALHLDCGALAIVRDGEVLHEAALTWSAVSTGAAPLPGRSELLRRYAFLSELTEYLRAAFAALRRAHDVTVTDIKTCGSFPDLRALTMPLADEFDLEVEVLDAPDALPISMGPEAAARARDVIASLQIALAAGRRWHHSRGIGERLRGRGLWVPAAAIAAVLVLALWFWQRGGPAAPPSPPPRVASRAAAPVTPERRVPARTPEREPAAVGTVATSAEPTPTPPPPAQEPTAQPPVPGPKPASPASRPRPLDTAVAPVKRLPPRVAAPARPAARGAEAPRPRGESTAEGLPAEGPQAPSDRFPAAPLEVTSILWSADRKLAIVNGSILGVGDTIQGFEVVEVRQDSIIVRNSAGRLLRAALGAQKP